MDLLVVTSKASFLLVIPRWSNTLTLSLPLQGNVCQMKMVHFWFESIDDDGESFSRPILIAHPSFLARTTEVLGN
jgi:hypothetical protein